MKKLLLILLCVPLIFSCGEKEKDDINELKGNNNKYEYYPINGDEERMIDIDRDGYEFEIKFGKIFNKETGELWIVYMKDAGHHGVNNIFTRKIVSSEALK